MVIVLILACALAASLIGSSVKSKPHDVPFGVVGSSALVSAVGKQVSLKPIQYPNEAAVRRAIDQTKIFGALIPGNQRGHADRRPGGELRPPAHARGRLPRGSGEAAHAARRPAVAPATPRRSRRRRR